MMAGRDTDWTRAQNGNHVGLQSGALSDDTLQHLHNAGAGWDTAAAGQGTEAAVIPTVWTCIRSTVWVPYLRVAVQ